MIDDGRDAIVGRDMDKIRMELFALGEMNRNDAIVECGFFQKQRDFIAIRGRPVVQIQHSETPGNVCANALAGQFRLSAYVWYAARISRNYGSIDYIVE